MSLKFIYLSTDVIITYLFIIGCNNNLFIFSPLEVELLKTFCSTETFLPPGNKNQKEREGKLKKKQKKDKINLFDLPGEPPPMLGGSKSMPAGFAGRFGDEATVPEAF